MPGPVLIVHDGSDDAGRSIRRAATLLRSRPAVLLRVRRSPLEAGVAGSGRRLALDAGFDDVEPVTAGGEPASWVVLREARERGASVIVVRPGGRSPVEPLGLAGALVEHSEIPVLVARPDPSRVVLADPVFACYDGSPLARDAIAVAAELLAGREAVVASFMPAVDDGVVLRSTLPWPVAARVQDRLAALDREEAEAPPERAREGAQAATDAGFAAHAVAIPGAKATSGQEEEPWRRLLLAAEAEDAACIVVGHRPSAGPPSGTAPHLVRHADRSVLVVPGT